jgi:hypothetical protein
MFKQGADFDLRKLASISGIRHCCAAVQSRHGSDLKRRKRPHLETGLLGAAKISAPSRGDAGKRLDTVRDAPGRFDCRAAPATIGPCKRAS